MHALNCGVEEERKEVKEKEVVQPYYVYMGA